MIKSKIYYYVRMELLSPISIGNGDDLLTDHDCLRNSKGVPFIPGTSLAGVFSHYLSDEMLALFTPKIGDEYKQSPYYISDANIVLDDKKRNVSTSIRDGVKLKPDKIAEDGANFDFEIVESSTKFDFRIEVIVRDHDNIDKMKKVVDVILHGLNSGEILLGYKSKRGYGKVKIEDVKIKEFTKNSLEEMLLFDKYQMDKYDQYSIPDIDNENKYDYMQVHLRQVGGISIRKYSATAGEVDFEHVTSNGKPVIPGTSWNGLIRRQIAEYLDDDIISNCCVKINDWFGEAKKRDTTGRASNIIIEESIIQDAKRIQITRNKISRFSAGVSNRALFSEVSYFNGDTVLGIKVKKSIEEDPDNSRIIGLLSLVIKDIDNGFIALGGQTAIGRGLFKVLKVTLNGNEFNLDTAISKVLRGE